VIDLDLIQGLLLIAGGIATTLEISIFSLILGLAIGLPLSFVRIYGGRLRFLVDGFEKIFRGIPELVLMLFFYLGVGAAFPFPFKNAFFTAVFVLGLRSGANQSQIFRGAIRGIGEEQMVASRSLGLSRLRSIAYVMIPQVFIFSTPGLGSEYALLVKDSAYAFVIGVPEIMKNADLVRAQTYDYLVPYFAAAIFYILLTFPIATWLDVWGGRRKKKLGL
jgi:polar amino acid transport system permease protein